MILIHDYKQRCWWCNAEANTREHRYKRADLVREFGRGPYRKNKSVVRCKTGQSCPVQGPNSIQTKFDTSLCEECNNHKSREFDAAYDIFAQYIKDNENQIQALKAFEFSKIYGNNWEQGRSNLIKYYVKHICCRLAESNIFVEPDIARFFEGKKDLKFIAMDLEIREDIVALIKSMNMNHLENGNMWLGDLVYEENSISKTKKFARSFVGYRWLRMNYLYDNTIAEFRSNFESNYVMLKDDFNVNPQKVFELFQP